MFYKVKQGDSPARIAKKYGVHPGALVSANPHKPTTVVANTRTWQSLRSGETVRVPVGVGDGYLGAIAPAPLNAAHGQISITNPGPHVANADVALWQSIIGVTADGLFGPNTQAATKSWQSAHGLVPDGIVGPKTWAAAVGSAAAAAPAAAIPSLPSIIQQLPSILSPTPAPSPIPVSIPTVIPTVTPVNAPAAAQALASVDPCYSGNVAMVCAAQAVLGVTVDGKYGNDTSAALRRLIPSAPAGCSPRPSWWKPTGQSNCTSGAAIPPPLPPSLPPSLPSLPLPTPAATIPVPSTPVPTAIPSAPSAAPTATATATIPSTQAVTAPEPKKPLSTGTIVVGAIGAVALVGLIAVAVSGKKHTPSRHAPTSHRSKGHRTVRKHTHRKRR